MAIFGLQEKFVNTLLNTYFNNKTIENSLSKEWYIGLGLTQEGGDVNMDTFSEVSSVDTNYKREPVPFGVAIEGFIYNSDAIQFLTATSEWTTETRSIEMIGLFTSAEPYENELPSAVLRLPRGEKVTAGETLLIADGAIQLRLTDF